MQNLNVSEIENLIKKFTIPCHPQILSKVMLEFNKVQPNIDYICMMINTDVSLSASVIQIANSPLFHRNQKKIFHSIDEAANVLGPARLKKLVQTLAIRDQLDSLDDEIELMMKYWDSASEVAACAAHLAQRLFCCSPDNAYMLGLFRDCGIPAMIYGIEGYKDFFLETYNNPYYMNIAELEDLKFGINHQTVGFCLAQEWNLPTEICRAILTHEKIEPPDSQKKSINSQKNALASIVYVGEAISERFQLLNSKNFQQGELEWRTIPQNVLLNLEIARNDLMDLMEDTLDKLEGLLADYKKL